MYFKSSILLFIFLQLSFGQEDRRHWKRLAEDDIHEALEYKQNNNVAKNVIVFIGDGMDLNTVTAARIYKYGEDKYLAFEKFPDVGILKTYAADKLVPDSACTASALFSGVKIDYNTLGVTVAVDDCEGSLKPKNRLPSIFDWAQEVGKSTGFVTTTRVTHATPAGLYAKSPNRKWECEAFIPDYGKKCKDIARQLIEDTPGKNINVIFGGGRQVLISDIKAEIEDPVDSWACYCKDGRNLIHDWEQDKQHRGVSHSFVQNRMDLLNLDLENNDYVLGIFANSHMYLRNDNGTLNVVNPRKLTEKSPPSLREMSDTAIKLMQKNKNGYVLMVEGGLIDHANHRGRARSALQETIEFNEAIESALKLTKEQADETLIIVTSDHAHSLNFVGYPSRKDGVLGIGQRSKWDKIPMTALVYATGGPNNYQFEVINGTAFRRDPTQDNTTSYEYSQQTGMVLDETAHSGTDIVVYAKGPMAHLFNSVHEQTYIAYVVAYSAKMGPYKDSDVTNYSSKLATTKHKILTFVGILFTILVSTLLLN